MRNLNKMLYEYDFDLWNHSIVLMYRGSIAHNTYIPNHDPNSIDDKDILGIAFPPKDYFFGLKKFEQYNKIEGIWDVLIYDFKKAIKLLMKTNPNILQVLWTDKEYILKSTPVYEKLVENRNLFVHKGIYKTFCGYGYGQLNKMKNMSFNGYMGEKRKSLVNKYGYDTKNAQHLIRILRQGIEFLETGNLIVKRPDADQLKQIKQGEWSLEKVKNEANKLFIKMEDVYKRSKLPDKINFEKINKLTIEIMYDYYIKKEL